MTDPHEFGLTICQHIETKSVAAHTVHILHMLLLQNCLCWAVGATSLLEPAAEGGGRRCTPQGLVSMPGAPQNLQGGLPGGAGNLAGFGGLGSGPDALASVRLHDDVMLRPCCQSFTRWLALASHWLVSWVQCTRVLPATCHVHRRS